MEGGGRLPAGCDKLPMDTHSTAVGPTLLLAAGDQEDRIIGLYYDPVWFIGANFLLVACCSQQERTAADNHGCEFMVDTSVHWRLGHPTIHALHASIHLLHEL